ncbi:ATP-dependent helicase [Ancylobacter dichloromethanicus]|uniref:DNA 3'-5' helicase n=1 Tax=Ancylobacter dichloromethanicus TaxID=518825 RepID=A0A9W6J727_9HYPH|nr:ATP-dependent helicase [Ancylobacter dichloromethanicus]MBS7553833.1 ATP-dependent helicase [Ancylobacter dichloromethanicus]GLK70938.1 DNA helicase [Ancylobacter dichloromethanicus]
MLPAAYLDRLNPQQRRAVEHGISGAGEVVGGPLLVIAGAGSGKTDTLAHRVAHLIVNKADPRRILLLTFSRRAAAEMARRVERIAARVLGADARALTEGLTWAGTFHGIGARLLRDHAREIGLDPNFTIHDREDSADLINLIRHELGFSKTEKRFPAKGTLIAIYSRAVNAEQPLEEVIGRAFPWCAGWNAELKAIFAAYVEAKQRQNVLDYDDLLLYWAQMMAEKALAAEVSGRFDHVLVDEYQDTNRLQSSILLGLKPDGRGLTVVGDDAQSIYSFRAATVRNILDFPGHFTPRADTVMLEQNYRSTQPILAAANAVIDFASERYAKNLWSERTGSERPVLVGVRDEIEQANFIATRVLENREDGIALKAQAVLFRAAHHSGPLEVELTRRNIPFVKFGGLKFLDSAHVKDVLGVLRFIENPRDRVAGFRVLRLMSGLGPATAGRILDAVASAGALLPALETVTPPARAETEWPSFLAMTRDLKANTAGWPGELDRVRAWYEPLLERLHEDAGSRQADLVQLAQIAASYPSRARFLTELTLDPPSATSAEAGPPHLDEDYLILSTIHSAKGQEWKSVFVLNVVDGCIPIDLGAGTREEIEEERRLLYVAMTRAKDSLHLMLPQRFFTHGQAARGDRHVYAARTRFIPPTILNRFAMASWPPAQAEAPGATGEPRASVDLGARMRAMWK